GKSLGTHRFQRAGFIISDIQSMSEIMNPARWKRCVPRGDLHCFSASQRDVKAPRGKSTTKKRRARRLFLFFLRLLRFFAVDFQWNNE
ncbi:MAG: hypothetical protein ACREA2_18610, partial [Blastocatellia bacterium]